MVFSNEVGTALIRGLLNGIPLDEEPTVKKALYDEELRWRHMVDKVCEGNEELTELKDAISDMRMRRKREFRMQQTAQMLAPNALAPSSAYIEEIGDGEIGPSAPLAAPSSPAAPAPPFQGTIRDPGVEPVSSPDTSIPPGPTVPITRSLPPPTVPVAVATPEVKPTPPPRAPPPAVRCIICNLDQYTPGPVTHCSQRCMEVAKITWILCGSPSSQKSKPDFTRKQIKVVQAALGPYAGEEALMQYCQQPQERQVVLDLLQWLLDNQPKWPSNQTTVAVHTEIRRRLRQLITKFSLASDYLLPSSLFLTGVSCEDKEALFGGSFADIFIGEYDSKKVALKRLRVFQNASKQDGDRLKKRLCYELLIWRNLSHQYILPVFGVDETIFCKVSESSGTPAIVLPWMEHGSIINFLRDLTEDHTFDAVELRAKVLNWVHQMVLGLQYLHCEGVVHGDFRADNVLVDSDENICLTDFGLSVFQQEASETYGSTRAGNVRWLAPELIDPDRFQGEYSKGRPTFASDIYSFACVCVELYTCRSPFTNQFTDGQLHIRVPLGARPTRPNFLGGEEMDDTLWSIVTRCWDQVPSSRPNAEELVAEISGTLWLSPYMI